MDAAGNLSCGGGGPPVGARTYRGFGTRLIERSLAGDLDGELRLEFAPTGLVCTVNAPLPVDPFN